MECHAMLWIKKGNGLVQIDFKAYDTLEDKIIYLSPGQYIRFLTGTFEVWAKEFSPETILHTEDARVLFKHLVSYGHIENSASINKFFSASPVLGGDDALLHRSVKGWFQLNPFHAGREEYKALFDFGDRLDEELADKKKFSLQKFKTDKTPAATNRLLNKFLGFSLKKILQKRLMLEAQRELAFSDTPVKQLAFQLGYNDAAYFNRFFTANNGVSPLEFRKAFNYDIPDSFMQNLRELIGQFHKTEHSTAFYADKMHMSIKTLIRKTNEKFFSTAGRLIRNELYNSAKDLLHQGIPVNEVADELGFKEPNHFSAFFKSVSKQTPSSFRSKKCNE